MSLGGRRYLYRCQENHLLPGTKSDLPSQVDRRQSRWAVLAISRCPYAGRGLVSVQPVNTALPSSQRSESMMSDPLLLHDLAISARFGLIL